MFTTTKIAEIPRISPSSPADAERAQLAGLSLDAMRVHTESGEVVWGLAFQPQRDIMTVANARLADEKRMSAALRLTHWPQLHQGTYSPEDKAAAMVEAVLAAKVQVTVFPLTSSEHSASMAP